jgi:hypothetical protein
MKHEEELQGIAAEERDFIQLENLKVTLCGHLFKLSQFVQTQPEE